MHSKITTGEIYKSIDESKVFFLILLDLSKAFDSVNYDLLLHKLVQLNIDGTSFESYLNEKTHSVNIDKSCPNHFPIHLEYLRNQYSVQFSLTFLPITLLKQIHCQELKLVLPSMPTMFNSCSVAHVISSS